MSTQDEKIIPEETVLQAKKGDKQAFATLYETVYQDLYRFAVYTLGNAQDAEDVVADTVVAAYAQIASLKNASSFRAWMFAILSNKCRKVKKDYGSRPVELDETHQNTATVSDTDFAESAAVREVFAGLADEERLILSMHLFAGYNSSEIGKILGMKPATVRSKEHRAMKRLREEWA